MSASPAPEGRRPGEWPVTRTTPPTITSQDGEYVRTAEEQARRYFTVSRIRDYLAEEFSVDDVREAALRWITDITEVADEIVRARQGAT